MRKLGYLPAELGPVIGRAELHEQVAALLSGQRLVTLTGPGGVGKSMLARHVASTRRDAVWLVDLDWVDPSTLETLWRHLGTLLRRHDIAGKAPLVVIDNCDPALRACAHTCATLLQRHAGLCLLVTSREPLGVACERVMSVPPLSLPEGGAMTASELGRSEAASLFLERATANAPGLTWTADDIPYIVDVCRRLDGIPMAIEFAAERVRTFGLRWVAALLRDRRQLLNLGTRVPRPERQRSLRASLEWSIKHLGTAERDLLRRLASLPTYWTLEDVESACRDVLAPAHDAIPALLEALVSKSLVLVEYSPTTPRFWMPQVLQVYALELPSFPRALTARERDVLALVARGYSNREIGAHLVISEATARIHVEHILTKLDLRSRTQAAIWALQRGHD